MTPIPAIVLAAGASRRLGTPKQLLMLGGETLLERTLRVAKEAGAAPAIAVLGAHAEQIAAATTLNDSFVVINAHWSNGIASSIHAGLNALARQAPDATGALLLTCDQVRLTTGHLRALLDAFDAGSSVAIVASSYAGVTGVPAVFPRGAFQRLFALRGDQGARALFKDRAQPLITVPLAGGEVDIDLPDDLVKLE
jgi:CTP:molybdopterin cytidylyltransferase MocA